MRTIKRLIKKCDFSLNKKNKQELLEKLLVIIDLRNTVCSDKTIIKIPKERVFLKNHKNFK